MADHYSITQEPSLVKLFAGILGSIVSVGFIKAPPIERMFMAFGGAALSWFAAPWVAKWLNMSDAEGLVGFLLGLFGMAIVAKLYELVQSIDTAALSKSLNERLSKIIGG